MAPIDRKTKGSGSAKESGSIAGTAARLEVWARNAPRGLARVEFHSEYARAEADRVLQEALRQQNVPYHQIALPVRRSPSEVVRTLLESLATLEPGVVSITGFATACADDERANLLGALTLNRENLAEFNLRQIWWMTSEFTDAFIRTVPDLASWFFIGLHILQEFRPPSNGVGAFEAIAVGGPTYRVDEALRRASSLVERFQRARAAGAPPSELLRLVGWAAQALVEVGAPHQTKELANQLVLASINLYEHPNDERPESLRSLISLAKLLWEQRRLAEAGPLIGAALAMAERNDDVFDLVSVEELSSLVVLLRDTNQLRSAEDLARRLLARDERRMGPDNPQVATNLNNLGVLLKDTNRLGEAEPLLRRALAINEMHYGSNHPSVALRLNNLASVLHDATRFAEAEPLYRRALGIWEVSFGPEHPNVAIALANLALSLFAKGELATAEPLLRRSLRINDQHYGPEHPSVAISLNNLAGLLRATNQLAEAESLFNSALAIDERCYGADNPHVGRDLNNLALLFKATSRLKQAEAYFGRALEIFLRFVHESGHGHRNLDDVITNYQDLLATMGQSPEEILARLDELGRPFGMKLSE